MAVRYGSIYFLGSLFSFVITLFGLGALALLVANVASLLWLARRPRPWHGDLCRGSLTP